MSADRAVAPMMAAPRWQRIALVVIALAANIGFYLPKVPAAGGAGGIPGLDKVVHISVFALTVWAVGRLVAPVRRFPMGWVVLGALTHAGLIELVQSFEPARSADPGDLLADADIGGSLSRSRG